MEIQRAVVFGPELAKFKINSDAKKKHFKQAGEDKTYLACRRMVPGGLMMVYVFGDAKPGSTVTVQAELRNRSEEGVITHYVRVEVVNNCGQRATHKLYVGNADDPKVVIDRSKPFKIIREHGAKALVGFIAV